MARSMYSPWTVHGHPGIVHGLSMGHGQSMRCPETGMIPGPMDSPWAPVASPWIALGQSVDSPGGVSKCVELS
eukprot:136379-Lingulodinium_polyedra.AAC.1